MVSDPDCFVPLSSWHNNLSIRCDSSRRFLHSVVYCGIRTVRPETDRPRTIRSGQSAQEDRSPRDRSARDKSLCRTNRSVDQAPRDNSLSDISRLGKHKYSFLYIFWHIFVQVWIILQSAPSVLLTRSFISDCDLSISALSTMGACECSAMTTTSSFLTLIRHLHWSRAPFLFCFLSHSYDSYPFARLHFLLYKCHW